MSKAGSIIQRLERRLQRQRPTPQQMYIIVYSDDDGNLIDEGGRRYTPEEWARLHPDTPMIKLTWGDADPAHDRDLTRPIPSAMWRDI